MKDDTGYEYLPFAPLTKALEVTLQPEFYSEDVNPPETEVKKMDMVAINNAFKLLYLSIGSVNSISAVSEIIKQTKDLVKMRRDVLGMKYGVEGNRVQTIDIPVLD